MVTTDVTVIDQPVPAWHRWFRRTNVYIGEYILMLILMGMFLGLLIGLWYSFFQLILHTDYTARDLAVTTAGQLGSLLVIGPAAYWLYARVTGQEGIQPALQQRTARTVFLTIWLLVAVLSLVGLVASVVSGIVMAVFGLGDSSASDLWVGMVVPGLLAAVTLAFGIYAVVKHASRRFVMRAAVILAVIAAVLLVLNVVMIMMRKDVQQETPVSNCSYSQYLDRECSYSEYMDHLRQSSSNDSSLYRDKSSIEDLFDSGNF